MSNETVVRVTADASGYTAEMERAKKSAASFAESQEQASARVAASQAAIAEAAANGSNASAKAINSFISALTRQADSAGKTRAEMLTLKAAQLGVSQTAASSIAQIEAAAAASSHAGEAMHEFSLNSAGARRELLVLAHEASQGNWKNFAGSLQVLGEKTDFLAKLMSPLALTIGAVVGVAALATYHLIENANAFDQMNKSIYLTNGYLGISTGQFRSYADQLAGTAYSAKTVEEALNGLVRGGQVTADTLQLSAKVALEFSHDSGEALDKVTESLNSFAKDPAKAINDLQSQYHLFSAAQAEVIEKYIDTGDKASAYKAIIEGMDAAHTRFKTQATADIGAVGKLWEGLKILALSYTNSIAHAGVAATAQEDLNAALKQQAGLQAAVNQLDSNGAKDNFGYRDKLAAANTQVAAIQKVVAAQAAAAAQQAKIAAGGDAVVAVHNYTNDTKYASPLEQRTLAIKAENAAYADATKDVDKTSTDFVNAEKRHADNLAEIDKQYASRNGSKAAASAAATAAQQAIKAQIASLDDQQKAVETSLKSSLDHIKSLQQQGLITQQQALAQSYDDKQNALQKDLGFERQQEEIAKGEKNKQAYKKYGDEIKATQDKITANAQQYTDDVERLNKKRLADLTVYTSALQQQLNTQQEAANNQLQGLSMGGNDRAYFDKQIAIRQDYDKKVADLAKQSTENKIDPDQYSAELKATQDYYNQSVAIAQKSSADILAANANWTTGASRAIADYGDEAANVAASTASTFQDAFRGMEDVFATFVTTGKLSFTDLATSVIADIARMQARAAIASGVSALSGLFGLGAASLADEGGEAAVLAAGFADGGHISGPGSGTSDSIPIWASNGEYVMKASAVQRIGVRNLDAANNGQAVHSTARFASGGLVSSAASSSTGSAKGGDITVNAPVNVQGGNNAAANQSNGADLNKKITAAVKAVVANERKQGGSLWKMQNGIA